MTTSLDAAAEQFRTLIGRKLGLALSGVETPFLADVLHRRAAASGLSCVDYLADLAANRSPDEIGELARELTVPETYFFRNAEQFRALTEEVLHERLRVRGTGGRLRMLSVGCASGEEAYTIAMVAREVTADVSILGVDVNPAALRQATTGSYSAWSLRATPPGMRRRWFREEGQRAVLVDEIRQSVRFRQRNVMADDPEVWAPDAYDVIFCRNMLMYLTPPAMQAVVDRLTRALAPGGYLFLGHAESLRGYPHDLVLCQSRDSFYYQRPDRGGPGPTDLDWAATIAAAVGRVQGLAAQRRPVHAPAPRAVPPATEPAGRDRVVELLRRERFGEALAVVEALSPADARHPEAQLLYAVLLSHCGQFDRADELCRLLSHVDGFDAGAQYLLGAGYEGRGDPHGAVTHHRMAAFLDPGFAMPRLRLGLLARQHGDHELARRELAQARTLLSHEDADRLLLFGGGFTRDALIALCHAELVACGGAP
jgi:chemotaxis protein methyltransferase CheR